MTNEERVIAKYVDANPVPDVYTTDLVQVGGIAYLTDLTEREASTPKPEIRPAKEKRRLRGMVALAASLTIVVLAIVAVAALQVGEPEPAATIPAEDMVGHWGILGTGLADHVDLFSDGSYEADVSGTPVDAGTYSINNNHIVFESSTSEWCEPGANGSYKMGLNGKDTISLTKNTDECDARADAWSGQLLIRKNRMP